jgi:hypothetical protein
VEAVSCKIDNCSIKAVKGTQYKLEQASFIHVHSKGLFLSELFFFRNPVQATVLRNNVQQFIAKSAKSEKLVFIESALFKKS